jgi:ribosomal protein L40E
MTADTLSRKKTLYPKSAPSKVKEACVRLVYCVRCGAKNPDDAAVCAQCGKPIAGVERARTRHEEEMCFGMPSHMGGVLVGLFIIILGAALLYQRFVPGIWDIFWPLLLIFVGIAVLVGGAYRYSRR